MPAIFETAPAKTILVGEHAVVYGQPAIAIPVHDLRVKVVMQALPIAQRGTVLIKAPDIALQAYVDQLPEEHPIAFAIAQVLAHFKLEKSPACQMSITSPIPIGTGLGSSAAVSVAILKAYASFLGQALPREVISAMAYEVEKITHGTPSGIDNSVIAYEAPVYFVRGQAVELLQAGERFEFLIANTGIAHKTSEAVAMVREKREANPGLYDPILQQIGELANEARSAILKGDAMALGRLMNANQTLLGGLGLSTPELAVLIQAGMRAGALGAKLTGAGMGGNVLVLVEAETRGLVEEALRKAGATAVYHTQVGKA